MTYYHAMGADALRIFAICRVDTLAFDWRRHRRPTAVDTAVLTRYSSQLYSCTLQSSVAAVYSAFCILADGERVYSSQL